MNGKEDMNAFCRRQKKTNENFRKNWRDKLKIFLSKKKLEQNECNIVFYLNF